MSDDANNGDMPGTGLSINDLATRPDGSARDMGDVRHHGGAGPKSPATESANPPSAGTKSPGTESASPPSTGTESAGPASETSEDEADEPPARRGYTLRHVRSDVRGRLVDVLLEHTDEIRLQWCAILRDTASPLYHTLPEGELEASMAALFNAHVDYLRTGNPAMLGRAIAAVARVRFTQGFSLSGLEEAVGAMRDAVLPLIIRHFAAQPDDLSDAVVAIMMGEELSTVRIAEAYQEVISAQLRAAQEEALRAEREKVLFCREMTRMATHEKLILCDPEDLPVHDEAETHDVQTPRDVRDVRHLAAEVAAEAGLGEDRSYALQLCIGEAGTNAIRHAGAATFQVWNNGLTVTFRLADTGPGIDFCHIPAALRSGFSTGSSLGMGFTLMLELADSIHLATDHRGTTVQLTIARNSK